MSHSTLNNDFYRIYQSRNMFLYLFLVPAQILKINIIYLNSFPPSSFKIAITFKSASQISSCPQFKVNGISICVDLGFCLRYVTGQDLQKLFLFGSFCVLLPLIHVIFIPFNMLFSSAKLGLNDNVMGSTLFVILG